MNIEDVAHICHESNRAYCETLGDQSQPPWSEAPDWQKESAVNGLFERITVAINLISSIANVDTGGLLDFGTVTAVA